jgi:hypothetical protein
MTDVSAELIGDMAAVYTPPTLSNKVFLVPSEPQDDFMVLD